MKIFLLEDDTNLAFGIKTYLEKNAYQVENAQSLAEAKEIFNYSFDFIILDMNLPDGNAFDFLDLFELEKTPFIFLTVNDAEEDIIKGLNVSDGYITKPFKLAILKAKIESILRRTEKRETKLNFKTLVLDLENFSCQIDGQEIDLTVKEYEVLKLLMLNQGSTLTREKILDLVWGLEGDFILDNTLSATVRRLRKKLANYSSALETVWGIGYRFVRD